MSKDKPEQDPFLNKLSEMSPEFLQAVFDAFPGDISILDADDKVQFWSKHDTRVFEHNLILLENDVRFCHPPSSIEKVLKVIEVLRTGERNHVDFWLDFPDGETPRKLLIRYIAIRDKAGTYLGTLEVISNITPLQAITGENRIGNFD